MDTAVVKETSQMIQDLIRHTRVLEIVGDMIRVRATGVALGDLSMVDNTDGETSLARVVGLDHGSYRPTISSTLSKTTGVRHPNRIHQTNHRLLGGLLFRTTTHPYSREYHDDPMGLDKHIHESTLVCKIFKDG